MLIPNIVKNEKPYVQRAFVKEFEKNLDTFGSAIKAHNAAMELLNAIKPDPNAVIFEEKHVIFDGEIAELESNVIPADILASIKEKDPHPFFAVCKIGKDGISNGEKIKKFWSFGAIKELAKRIKECAADAIEGHTKGVELKPSLGKAVWAYTKNIGKSLYSYAVMHITDPNAKERIKNGELDTCSVEGDVKFTKKNGTWFIDQVVNITKLALADSSKDKPGFAGAGIVATIQELEETKGTKMAGDGVENISVYEVKVAIEKLNLKPKDLFRTTDLLEVDTVKKHVESEVDKAKTEKQKEVDELTKKLEPLEAKERSAKLSGIVEKSPLLTDKPAKLIQYIKDKASSLKVDDENNAANAVDEFIKQQLDDVKKYGLSFADDDEDGDDVGENEDAGSDKTTQKKHVKKAGKVDATDVDDMSNPENNDNIPD